jgi:outer membrane protein OmpA-like peptidoglycan-associated protein
MGSDPDRGSSPPTEEPPRDRPSPRGPPLASIVGRDARLDLFDEPCRGGEAPSLATISALRAAWEPGVADRLRAADPTDALPVDPRMALARVEALLGAGRWSLRIVDMRVRPGSGPIEPVDLAELAEPEEPASPSEPPAAEATTFFEVKLVDELGEPIAGITVTFRVDGGERTAETDAGGVARIDDAASSFASVSIHDTEALREPLHERWRSIRPGDWLEPEDERTVLQLRREMPSVSLRAERLHEISIQPRVVLARLLGMLFQTDKTFLLPSALGTIRDVARLYEENAGATVLAVGHTDSEGGADYNLQLSSARAASVSAYLRDAIDEWLAEYQPKPVGLPWGTTEDLLMIGAMPDAASRDPSEDPVRWYQRTRGLEVDGVAGPNTRRELVGEYMAFDGTSLPPETAVEVHGCGEHFPAADLGDDVDSAENRRVELFFFEDEVMPPPPGPTSGPDAPEYPEWCRRARETHDFRPGAHVMAPLYVSWSQTILEILPADTVLVLEGDGIETAEAQLADGEIADGLVAFAFGEAALSATCTLTARGGGREVVLWRDQVPGRSEPPLEWSGDLAELADPATVADPNPDPGDGILTADTVEAGDPPGLEEPGTAIA